MLLLHLTSALLVQNSYIVGFDDTLKIQVFSGGHILLLVAFPKPKKHSIMYSWIILVYMVVGSIKRHFWRHFLALFKRKIAVLRFCAHHFTAGHTVNGLGQAVRCSHHTGAQPKPMSQSGTPAMCSDKSVGWVKCACLTDCNQTLWTLHHHHTLTHLNKTHFFLIPFCSSFIGIFQIIRSSCQIPENIPYLFVFCQRMHLAMPETEAGKVFHGSWRFNWWDLSLQSLFLLRGCQVSLVACLMGWIFPAKSRQPPLGKQTELTLE